MSKINFPILWCTDNMLGAVNSDLFEKYTGYFNDNELICKVKFPSKFPVWVIDLHGWFYKLEFYGVKKRKFYHFVYPKYYIYTMSNPRKITVAEVLEITKELECDELAPVVDDLRNYLSRLNKSEYISEEILTEWKI